MNRIRTESETLGFQSSPRVGEHRRSAWSSRSFLFVVGFVLGLVLGVIAGALA